MIVKITKSDRKRNPTATKGKQFKLVSKKTRRVLGYGSKSELKQREKEVAFFKHR